VSRQRALRRAERERAAARAADVRRRRADRAGRRRAARAAIAARLPRRTRWHGQQGILARRRRMQNAVILGLFLLSQALAWLFTDDPWLRLTAALLAVLALPVLVTLVLDRRS
jgi:hypothetical protein